ncbi:MAG: hypothetical protein SFU83_04370 [Meiothermus sp.]|nr:hypothetical protein [Meiothermus sp.]
MMTTAHNLEDALGNLDPMLPLGPEDEAFFVERDFSQRRQMVRRLQLALRTSPTRYSKFLFSGQKGSGKGTELYRLNKELGAEFFLVHFSVQDKLDIYDLDYRDVVFSVGLGIVEAAKSVPAVANAIPDEMLKPIVDFFAEVYQEQHYKEKYESAVELKPGILSLIAAFGRLGSERESRTTVRKRISGSLKLLVSAIGKLARFVEERLGKKILVIVEDLDKTNDEAARQLFFEYGKSLADIPVHVVYTFPVSLRNDQGFVQNNAYFQDFNLPNISIYNRDETDNNNGLGQLQRILTLRVSEGLFEPDALTLLAEQSGGLARSLISLANKACMNALLDNRLRISVIDVRGAAAEERADYRRILTFDQIDLLRKVRTSKLVDNSADYQQLLYNLSILEYRDDDPDPWYNVNPVVRDLL